MCGLIKEAIYSIYGPGLANRVGNWIEKMWEILTKIFSDGNLVQSALTTFSSVAAALCILYFLMELASQTSKDLLTLEKLVSMFVKYIIALVILLNMVGIMNGIMTVGKGIYEKTKESSITVSESGEAAGFWANYHKGATDKEKEDFLLAEIKAEYDGQFFKAFKALFSVVITAILGNLIVYVCLGICIMQCTTNTLQICVRGFMAPLAIPQMFEEGQRSTAIRYFKVFAAECLQMALMILTIKIAGELALYMAEMAVTTFNAPPSSSLLTPEGTINIEGIEDALSFKAFFPALLPYFATIGGMSGVSKITHDITG